LSAPTIAPTDAELGLGTRLAARARKLLAAHWRPKDSTKLIDAVEVQINAQADYVIFRYLSINRISVLKPDFRVPVYPTMGFQN
jgi:hypothetical protein